ncbi:hypothetical protein PIROE2DRAFT_48302 [Piromyces sp. E2]|nr:hypothetical protein PIROE2DRAFT_48302 [Piromyces sp. E2]|eukprot:OUM58010.1 hypothetical protein PIROE2DRAFT_48302 [Piromyces sp. E2]
MDNRNDAKIALLIDADNIAVKYLDTIFDELSKYGDIIIRRVYGNWLNNTIKGWLEDTSKYALNLVMQESNIPGKNATDICLVIDAMKLLYESKADMFCIASSDSDFTKLAKEIREHGIDVIGMGEDKTPQSFVRACKKFVVLNQIMEEELLKDKSPVNPNNTSDNISSSGSPSEIEKAIINIIMENKDKDKSTCLSEVGSRLSRLYPEFDFRNYGFSNLSTFVASMSNIVVSTSSNGATIIKIKTNDNFNLESILIRMLQSHNNKMNMGLLKSKLFDQYPGVENELKKQGYSKLTSYIRTLNSVKFDDKCNNVLIIQE